VSAVPGAPRPLPRWRRAVLRIAAAPLLLARRRRGPLVDGLGFPTPRHPEDLTAELPMRDEGWLAVLAGELWPDDEYAEILRCYWPDPGKGGDP